MTDHELRNAQQTTALRQYLAVEKLCATVDNMTPDKREQVVAKLNALMAGADARRQAALNYKVTSSAYIWTFLSTPFWAFMVWVIVRYS